MWRVVGPEATSTLKSGWVLPDAHTLGVRDWEYLSEVDRAELSYLLGLLGRMGRVERGLRG